MHKHMSNLNMRKAKRNIIVVIIHDCISLARIESRNFSTFFRKLPLSRSQMRNLKRLFFKIRENQNTATRLTSKMVLVDYFPILSWLACNALVADVIRAKTGAQVCSFGFSNRNAHGSNLYNIFGIRKHLRIRLKFVDYIKVVKIYKKILCNLESGSSVIDITVEDVKIGIDIYESILRRGRPTVTLEDHETYIQIFRGIKEFIYFQKKFEKKNIIAVMVSHDNYVGPGLLSRMSYKYGIPVILMNTFNLSILSKPFQLYERFSRIPEYFSAIPIDEQKLARIWARDQLEARISGEIGVGMPYQKESAFEFEKQVQQMQPTERYKILVLTHDFYDNPHAYARMTFNDFFEWLDFLGGISSETNYDWYIKPHRDHSKQEAAEIKKFISKYPNFRLVSADTSFHQLSEEGIDCALTCHGSAGHELPLLGIRVLNATHNPHVAYAFNDHARTKIEYRNIILELGKKPKVEIDRNKIYEFYYVYKRVMSPDDFVFKSFSHYEEFCNYDHQSVKSLEYISESLVDIRNNVISEFESAIKNRRVFSTEKILSSNLQEKVPLTSGNHDLFHIFVAN
jgi:hypothetical protein